MSCVYLKPEELAPAARPKTIREAAAANLRHALGKREPFKELIVHAVRDRIITALKPYPQNQRKQMLDKLGTWVQMGAPMERFPDFAEEANRLHDIRSQLDEQEELFKKLSGITWDEWQKLIEQTMKDVAMPPLTSANNVEIGAMGFAHVIGTMLRHTNDPGYDWSKKIQLPSVQSPTIQKYGRYSDSIVSSVCVYNGVEDEVMHKSLTLFLQRWRSAAYPKLEVGHRLAASLALTEIPADIEIMMPWPAWSLVIPDGLLGDLARVWVLDDRKTAADGDAAHAAIILNRQGKHPGPIGKTMQDMVYSLVCGVALALSNPDEFRKERHHKPSARAAQAKHRDSGPPDLTFSRFMLSAPVKVDLREHVAAALDDEKHGRKGGGSPKVQFIVRGHWRQQAYGPGHTLRKPLWIQPFWKGPEESRVLLRKVTLEE